MRLALRESTREKTPKVTVIHIKETYVFFQGANNSVPQFHALITIKCTVMFAKVVVLC